MSAVLRIQAVLAAHQGKKLRPAVIAHLAGYTSKEIGRHLLQMTKLGHVSRELQPDNSMHLYWLTQQQLSRFQTRARQLRFVVAAAGEKSDLCLMTPETAIPARLAFLRMLKERTVFNDNAVLGQIIQDYENTQKMQHRQEERKGK